MLIGGFEAYNSTVQLTEQRINYREFCIPLICVPATISNNIPGSDFSIGSDTALNEIVAVRVIFGIWIFGTFKTIEFYPIQPLYPK